MNVAIVDEHVVFLTAHNHGRTLSGSLTDTCSDALAQSAVVIGSGFLNHDNRTMHQADACEDEQTQIAG